MFPSFIFSGPRVEMADQGEERPFRVLPGGVKQYIE